MVRPFGRLALLAMVSLAGCGTTEVRSPSEECRVRYGLGRVRQPRDRVANVFEDTRCDLLEAEERADSRRSKAERAEKRRQWDDYYAHVRRFPHAPELGATEAEARALCQQQRGAFGSSPNAVGCSVGGATIFAGEVDAARIVRLDVYYENADLTEVRANVAKSLGPNQDERVMPDGFRAFVWKNGTVVAMYPRGVRFTVANSDPSN